MSDGRLALVLDPLGYYFADEEGISFSYDAQNLWSQGHLLDLDGFFSAPGSPWLMPQSRQFETDWWTNTDRAAHLMQHTDSASTSAWMIATGGVAVSAETMSLKTPGAAPAPADEWMGFSIGEAITGPPMDVNFYDPVTSEKVGIWHEILKKKNIRLPQGIEVIAASNGTIPARKFPFFRLCEYPDPDTTFVVGWGDLALVLGKKTLYLLKTRNEHQDWELLADTNVSGKWMRQRTRELIIPQGQIGEAGGRGPSLVGRNLIFHEFGIIPIGLEQIMIAGLAEIGGVLTVEKAVLPRKMNVNETGITPAQGRNGRWWIACAPKRQALVQVERMAWRKAQHVTDYELENNPGLDPDPALFPTLRSKKMFDFGLYVPTPPPKLFIDGLIHGDDADIDVVDLFPPSATDERAYGKIVANPGLGEEILVELLDHEFQPFDNSGDIVAPANKTSGYLHIRLTPSEDKESCPQLRLMTVKWPPVLKHRVRSLSGVAETIIEDRTTGTYAGPTGRFSAHLHWRNWRVSSSRSEFLGKIFEVEIVDTVHKNISTGELATAMDLYANRQSFPIEVREDTNNTGFYDVKRVRAWVQKIDRTEPLWQDLDGDGVLDTVTRVWKIRGTGLARRLDLPWIFLHAVEDPGNAGRVSHVEAIRSCLAQGGFDVGDYPGNTTDFFASSDEAESDAERYLPGDVRHRVSVSGLRERKNPYEPDPDDERAKYMVTVAKQWSGRDLYETLDGQIRYVRDMVWDLFQFGIHFPAVFPLPVAKFYRSHDEAEDFRATEVNAGRQPGLFMLDDPPPEIIHRGVQANTVRVSNKSDNNEILPAVIVRDRKSIYGPASYENFVGEPKTVVVETQFATDEGHLAQIAWKMLQMFMLRGELLKWATPYLPWTIGKGVSLDTGMPCEVHGHGYYIVIHTEVVADSHFEKATVYTAWKRPTPMEILGPTP